MQKYKIVRNYKFMAFLKIIIDFVFFLFEKIVTYHYSKYNNRNYTYYWEVFFWYVIFRKDYAKKEYNN